jgi:hypothetical protein
VPPASPGMAASQNSCPVVSWKPICGSLTTRAETMNQTMKASVRLAVVMMSVLFAMDFPILFQNVSSSGAQCLSHVV